MNLKFLILPIACGISFLPYSDADAAFRTNNNTVMAGRYGAYSTHVAPSMVANTPAPAPVDTTSAELESCQMIYPTGEFQIARPTIGLRAGGADQCVSVVKLVGYQMGPMGSNLVFATANVAAGDSFKCNIDSFPQAYMNATAVESVEFPRDFEPTMDDVIEVMNEEQKQNAGIKIAAAAIVGGLSGNLFGKNDLGKDNMLGVDKGKMKGTGIGMAGGAALMAASTYSGKVAGDVILSTGVNAAAGAVIGNATGAFGDGSALRIEKECKVKIGVGEPQTAKDCLWGVIRTGNAYDASTEGDAFWSPLDKSVVICQKLNPDDGTYVSCNTTTLRNIVLKAFDDTSFQKDFSRGTASVLYTDTLLDSENNQLERICKYYKDADSGKIIEGAMGQRYCKIKSASHVGTSIPVLLTDYPDKPITGWKVSEFDSSKFKIGNLYRRDSSGNGIQDDDILKDSEKEANDRLYISENFTPLTLDADDGGLVDFSNKARAKGTAIGGVAGGALGGISAYSGAQDEINERWVTAVREYKDSLQKFVCMTGDRFLSYYNDTVVIPYPQPIE